MRFASPTGKDIVHVFTLAGHRRLYRVAVLSIILLSFVFYNRAFLPSDTRFLSSASLSALHGHNQQQEDQVPCPTSPIIDDILVVLRTGATEIHDKLPIHLNTTLRCVPDLVIYSDYAESIADHPVHDVFASVSKTLIAQEPDFAHYRHLQQNGRDGLNTTTPHLGSGPSGSENPAWKLDRFKFLPMMEEALRYRENASWYVFVEADTYLLWDSLLPYLAGYNATEAIYLGRQMAIGDVIFGHGGSGFMLSNAAMRTVVEYRNAHLEECDRFTVEQWAGDMVLGKVLSDAGIKMTWGWPHLEGNSVSFLDFNDTQNQRTPWCYAPVTYHHMQPKDVEDLFAFEQTWRKNNTAVLLYKDVFREFLLPKFGEEVEGWDNLAAETEPKEEPFKMGSVEECRRKCEDEPTCMQYSYEAGNCSVASRVRHGQDPKAGEEAIRSGWMVDRIARWMDEKDRACSGGPKDMWVEY
ncbi:hypothetical protein NX059_002231 [Plenodomus lindquistii]|nr:hypothetical protein NX059_002231 [Plenodomus lindquistii]